MRIVGGIVQHLDLQQVRRVIHLADFFDQPFHHVSFVVNRKLNRYPGQRLILQRWRRQQVFLVLHVAADHLVAMAAVTGKDHQQQEVRNQQRPVE